jgi:AraC-like DNA-binding protein
MWSNRIVESTDPDEFVSLVRPHDCRLLVTEKGHFKARSILVDFRRLTAQRRSERLARIIRYKATRSGILFFTEPGPSMIWNGAEFRYEQAVFLTSGETYLFRSAGAANWGAMTLAEDDMKAVCPSNPSCSAALVPGGRVVTPPPGVLARLRSLHESAGDVTGTSAGSIWPAEFGQWLEQALIATMLEIISVPGVRSDSMARQHHHRIIRRFLEMLEDRGTEPFPMQEISDAIGVSSRTLRMACQTQLGVSPTQYLLLCRMRLARRALRQADPAVTRVTDIATELGFWELGRFAVKYRQIFGETPSSTLKTMGSLGRKRILSL